MLMTCLALTCARVNDLRDFATPFSSTLSDNPLEYSCFASERYDCNIFIGFSLRDTSLRTVSALEMNSSAVTFNLVKNHELVTLNVR